MHNRPARGKQECFNVPLSKLRVLPWNIQKNSRRRERELSTMTKSQGGSHYGPLRWSRLFFQIFTQEEVSNRAARRSRFTLRHPTLIQISREGEAPGEKGEGTSARGDIKAQTDIVFWNMIAPAKAKSITSKFCLREIFVIRSHVGAHSDQTPKDQVLKRAPKIWNFPLSPLFFLLPFFNFLVLRTLRFFERVCW